MLDPTSDLSILPRPRRVELTGGLWRVSGQRRPWGEPVVTLSSQQPDLLRPQLEVLAEYLQADGRCRAIIGPEQQTGIDCSLTLPVRGPGRVAADIGLHDERYRLTVTADRVHLEAATPAGIAMGIQTFRQLLMPARPNLCIPCLVIEDEPATAWRGLHLDVSRHFYDARLVRRFIDLAALHKFNIFHWHLTDDQGWRLPVEGYPRLLDIAAWRSGTLIGHDHYRAENPTDGIRHGGFYTHEEIAEVIRYAAVRGVHVLPEVDVPGHVQALLAAYPEFGASGRTPEVRTCWGISEEVLNLEPETFTFLARLIDTLTGLFPFRLLHFGGDEAKVESWAASDAIRQRMTEFNISDVRHIQPIFTQFLERYLAKAGRRLIGWDELLDSTPPDPSTVIMCWRSGRPGVGQPELRAIEGGHAVVLALSSHLYFDFYQTEEPDRIHEPLAIGGITSLKKVYEFEPERTFAEHDRSLILGAQAQLWTEYIAHPSQLDYMTYPRACALSEAAWCGKHRRPWSEFQSALERHRRCLDRLGVSFHPGI